MIEQITQSSQSFRLNGKWSVETLPEKFKSPLVFQFVIFYNQIKLYTLVLAVGYHKRASENCGFEYRQIKNNIAFLAYHENFYSVKIKDFQFEGPLKVESCQLIP